MGSDDEDDGLPRPPFLEDGAALDAHLEQPGAYLRRHVYHGWWIAGGTRSTDGSWLVGVPYVAVVGWCRRHGVRPPAADAECVMLRHPRWAVPGDVGYERMDPDVVAKLPWGAWVVGQDLPELSPPEGSTLIAYGCEAEVVGALPGPPPGASQPPMPTGTERAPRVVTTVAYRLVGGFDAAAAADDLRRQASAGPWRLVAYGEGPDLARRAPLARWVERSFARRRADFAAGMPPGFLPLLRGSRRRRLLVLARADDDSERTLVVHYGDAPRGYAAGPGAVEFAERRYLAMMSVVPWTRGES